MIPCLELSVVYLSVAIAVLLVGATLKIIDKHCLLVDRLLSRGHSWRVKVTVFSDSDSDSDSAGVGGGRGHESIVRKNGEYHDIIACHSLCGIVTTGALLPMTATDPYAISRKVQRT